MVGELPSRAVRAARRLEQRERNAGARSAESSDAGAFFWPAVDRMCDRVLSELFDERCVEADLAREAVPTSIFAELAPRLSASSAHLRGHSPLAPNLEVGACLTRLVELLRFDRFDRVPSCMPDVHPTHYRSSRQQQFDLEVSQQLLARIRRDARLSEQAHVIRRSAALAESAMEHHYSRLLVDMLQSWHDRPRARFDRGQRDSATVTALAPGNERTRALLLHLAPFPYGLSYARLVAAELRLLAAPVQPLWLRDRELARLDAGARHQLERVRDGLACTAWSSTSRPSFRLDGLRDKVIAVCGAGPLPVTGLMLHTESDADVVLIDNDDASVAQAARLVEALEHRGVLREGAVRVVHGDAGTLRFVPPHGRASHSAESLTCDVVLVASLVDHDAKVSLARRLYEDEASAPMALLLRSAASLCAALAYEPVDTSHISTLGLPFCGESVPANLVFLQLDRDTAARRGVTCGESRELVVTAHGSVLNTTELYHRVRLPASASALRVSTDPERCLRVLSALRTSSEAP